MDDVRLPEFEVGDAEDARTHGRRSAQSGRVEFITRGDRRRMWAVEQKRGIALESLDPSTTPTDVARRYGITSGLLYSKRLDATTLVFAGRGNRLLTTVTR